MPYEPGQAKRKRELEEFYPDVPDHLVGPLWEWTSSVVQYYGAKVVETLGVLLRAGGRSAEARGITFDWSALRDICTTYPDAQLAVIEDLLPRYTTESHRKRLQQHLEDGHSAYVINEHRTGLAWRVDPATMEQARQAVKDAPETPAHWLTEAWNAAYSLKPNPRQAYDAAILAVESAYGPTVIPKETHYQLGKIIGAVRDGRASNKFTVDLEDSRPTPTGVEPTTHQTDAVLEMMRAISYGQKVRHGTDGPVTINSTEEARVAVQLAVTLVQIASSKAFRLT